jgi:glutathione S-transferase
MGLYQSDHPDVPGMKGLHLFHYMLSSCSQRARLGLEEKGLEWTSHHLDLPANEHVTSDYCRINPNGVVPTLVHDGQVVIESNDILEYLDDHFPDPPLRPTDADARAEMDRLIAAAAAFQPTIKVLSYERIFRPFRPVSEEEVALYEEQHPDPALGAFMRDYAQAGPAWEQRVETAEHNLVDQLDDLESVLGRASWLSGGDYGLADISWVINTHRLDQARVDQKSWPQLQDWTQRAMARPTFDTAVVSYRP